MNSESIHNQDKQNHSKSTQELIELAIGIKKVQEINDYVGQVFCLSMVNETPALQKMLLDFFLCKSLKSEDAYWDIVGVLRCRGSYEVFEAASKLCESKNYNFRELGVHILAQLGTPKKDFADESGVILLKLLENEENIDVVIAIAFALGHLKDSRGVAPLVKFKNHFRADVRESIVFGLLGQEDELAINALIELSADENQDVRNWATFGLGDMIETDTQAIRDALFQRVVDEKGDTDLEAEIRGEALLGLAKRKDKRVITFLIKELSGDSVGTLPVEAAREIGDSSLYPVLIELKEWWDVNSELLQEAIKNCSQEQT
ncbi:MULTISPECIES: HEAT repeat domain-containing protein [Nostocales]|nr:MULTISPECIES: HEAT repeat domain-containing protein [Nostocales]